MASSRLCDSCKSTTATLFCRADTAFLCNECDIKIHTANKLASRHERTPVNPFYEKTASSSDGDGGVEADSWILPKEGIETPNLFSDLEYLKIEVPSENSSGNDGVVPIQNNMFLDEAYFNFDLSSSSKISQNGFKQTVSSRSLDVGLVPEGGVTSEIPNTTTVAVQLSPAEREARVLRYREKRKNRKFEKTIRYASRKAYAEKRPRIKGRFVKRTDLRGNDDGDVGGYGGFGVVPNF